MKIIGIGRNYSEHIKELKNEKPDEPVVFLKPDTSLLRDNTPFYLPDLGEIHYEGELVIKISKEGKFIEPKFASKYYQEITFGVDFTARDLQQKAKEKGLPWTLAKGFNGSAPVGKFIPISELKNKEDIPFTLSLNGETKQKASSKEMIHSFDEIISYISKFITLKQGDLIFTGTPAGVGPVKIGDRIEGYIENIKLIDFEIR